MTSGWFQKEFTLPSKARGSYLITDDVVSKLPEITGYKVGLLHLFIQHTSCALSLNENWDSDVRVDMSNALDRIAPEAGPKGEDLYLHSAEGPDDMPVRPCPLRKPEMRHSLVPVTNSVLFPHRRMSRVRSSEPRSQSRSRTASWSVNPPPSTAAPRPRRSPDMQGSGHVAGHLDARVPRLAPHQESRGHDTRRETVNSACIKAQACLEFSHPRSPIHFMARYPCRSYSYMLEKHSCIARRPPVVKSCSRRNTV